MALARSSVDQFMQVATQLIQEAAAYSAETEADPATDANIRQVRTMTIALNAALGSVGMRPAPIIQPAPLINPQVPPSAPPPPR